jgi:hypothetical protein
VRVTRAYPPILCLTLAACIISQPARPYDGSWWKSLSVSEQDAFVSGYLDCYIWDAQRTDYSDKPIRQQRDSISSFYRANPQFASTPVPELLRKLARTGGPNRGAERHGVYGGDFWRQLSATGRVAFLRGYIACNSLYMTTRFSRTPETYAKTISRWYGVSDADESQLNDKTANDKIGDVLARLRDRASPK